MSAAILFKIFSACISLVLVNCNTTHSVMEPRVVGGATAKIKLYPHSVYLEAICEYSEWHCGSSILNQKILLTAAHCVTDCDGDWAINAFAGHEVIMEMKLYRKISSYIIHPKYGTLNLLHDIALLHMSKSLTFGTSIKRVMLSKTFPIDKDYKIAGWGTVMENPNKSATQLKVVKQKLMPNKDCKKAYKSDIKGEKSEGVICAKYNLQNRPSHGDSGSALITSQGIQVGLVSFRPEKTPEIIVYTNVSFYYPWISSNAKRLYCNG